MSAEPAEPDKSRILARDLLRLGSSAAGAALALGLFLEFVDTPSSPLFLASIGGTAVFLFGLTRTGSTATGTVRWSYKQRSDRCSLLPVLWQRGLGLRPSACADADIHACNQNGASARGGESADHDALACWIDCNLANRYSGDWYSCIGRRGLDSADSRDGPLSAQVVRKVPSLYYLGWLGRIELSRLICRSTWK